MRIPTEPQPSWDIHLRDDASRVGCTQALLLSVPGLCSGVVLGPPIRHLAPTLTRLTMKMSGLVLTIAVVLMTDAVAQRPLRNAGQPTRINLSLGMAEFIGNSAIRPVIRPVAVLAGASWLAPKRAQNGRAGSSNHRLDCSHLTPRNTV